MRSESDGLRIGPLRLLKTIFQHVSSTSEPGGRLGDGGRMILVLRFEEEDDLSTGHISNLPEKLQTAFPGILPGEDDEYSHTCGVGDDRHDFREEIERGITIPHLLEHVILHLLGGPNGGCSGFTGQTSVDIEKGINDMYYIVTDYIDRLQALVAVDLAMQVVSALCNGRTVRLDKSLLLDALHTRLSEMLSV